MKKMKCLSTALLLCLLSNAFVFAQGAPKPEPDVLLLTDGEKLIGHMQSATGAALVFKSDIVGNVTVDWSKVQELHTSGKFAAIPKGVILRKLNDASQVPQGTVSAADQKIQVSPGPQGTPTAMAVVNLANVVDEGAFQHAFHRQTFIEGWKGGATGGVSLTDSTQTNETFTGALNLVRSDPGENWVDLRSRTIFDFNDAYGKISQSGVPTVKTSTLHFDAEQDWYLNPRFFGFGSAALDHSFSQGLQLQQSYGGGLGFVVVKTANQEFDVKVSANFIDQSFNDSTLDKKLFGTVFGETYTRKFAHGVTLNEQGGVTPSWNETKAYSAFASAGVTFPVYHRFGFTLGAVDNFLNDPPPAFKKNSFQLTAGATYSFK
jgi:hypothetical protein